MGTQGWDEYHIHQTKRVSTKDQTNRWKERERERERERGGGVKTEDERQINCGNISLS